MKYQEWEYTTKIRDEIYSDMCADHHSELMNFWAQKGWECFHIRPNSNSARGNEVIYYFRRKL